MLACLQNCKYNGDDHKYSAVEQNTIWILDNCIYSSRVLHINFTSYDIHCEQDSMNPQTNCNVMVLSPESGEDAHPFWYAQVLGVFYAWVLHMGSAAGSDSFLISTDEPAYLVQLYTLSFSPFYHFLFIMDTPPHNMAMHTPHATLVSHRCGQEKLVRAVPNPGFFQKDSSPVN